MCVGAGTQPYELQLQDISCGTTFHQCVYMRIQQQPEVMHAGAETRAAYGQDRNAAYLPHLSLLYADMNQDTRQALLQFPSVAKVLLL